MLGHIGGSAEHNPAGAALTVGIKGFGIFVVMAIEWKSTGVNPRAPAGRWWRN